MENEVMNLKDVAALTGLSKSHLWKLTSTGGIPCYKRPGSKMLFFSRAEIVAWCLSGRKATNEEIEGKAATMITLKGKHQ